MHEPSKLCTNPTICWMKVGHEGLLHWRAMVRAKCERWFAVEEEELGAGEMTRKSGWNMSKGGERMNPSLRKVRLWGMGVNTITCKVFRSAKRDGS